MARFRTIKPKFWDDAKLALVTRDARLTYIAMWNFADDLGVIISKSVWLKSKIYPHDQINLVKFESWLRELEKFGFIKMISTSGKGSGGELFYYLPNLTKHQVINRPNYEDLFIDKKLLEEILEISLIDHGLFTDQSSQGGERRVKESKGKEWSGGEGKDKKHFFSDSEIFDKTIFQQKLNGSQYESANIDWYHEQIKNWADSKDEKKINWLAAAKNWMANDMKDGKFITKNFTPTQNGKGAKPATGADVSTKSVFDAIDRMPE